MEENLQSMIAEFFVKLDTKWYSTGIHKLISHYNECLHEQGGIIGKGKFPEESKKCCFEALSFFYGFCEQCDFIFETSLIPPNLPSYSHFVTYKNKLNLYL